MLVDVFCSLMLPVLNKKSLFRSPLCLTPHCLRQFARGLEWVRAVPPAAAQPAPTPDLGEPPQAARSPEELRKKTRSTSLLLACLLMPIAWARLLTEH